MSTEVLSDLVRRLMRLDQEMSRDAFNQSIEIRALINSINQALTEKARMDQPHIPHRDSDVADWIRRVRDDHRRDTCRWQALDDLLDEYRLRADVGRNLTGPCPSETPES